MKGPLQFLKNPATGKWVILATNRANRPSAVKGREPTCPFCPGRENLTPPEVFRVGSGGKDKPGWQIRVVPNKYPFAPNHEVIIDSPDHNAGPASYPPSYIAELFRVYRGRFRFWRKEGQVVIFYNYGSQAAASLFHPHAQLVVIPKKIGMDDLHPPVPENIIHESRYFTVFTPSVSDWPYEVWFLPRRRGKFFSDITDGEVEDLGALLAKILKKLEGILGKKFPLNFYIYHGNDWYLRLIPRRRIIGGFELATGVYVHSKPPEEAAKELSW